jgi:hypothetical protein
MNELGICLHSIGFTGNRSERIASCRHSSGECGQLSDSRIERVLTDSIECYTATPFRLVQVSAM